MSKQLETKVNDLEAQLAALRGDVEFLLGYSPHAADRRKQAERAAQLERVRACTTLAAFEKLAPADQTAWLANTLVPQLVEVLRNAKPAARDRVLARLNLDKRARVTFALAPAPQLVRVLNPQGFNTKSMRLTAAQAQTLTDVGVDVVKLDRHGKSDAPYMGDGWRGIDRNVVLAAATWQARLAVDARLAYLVEHGDVKATPLPDDEARTLALTRYLQTLNERSSDNAPQLPELP